MKITKLRERVSAGKIQRAWKRRKLRIKKNKAIPTVMSKPNLKINKKKHEYHEVSKKNLDTSLELDNKSEMKRIKKPEVNLNIEENKKGPFIVNIKDVHKDDMMLKNNPEEEKDIEEIPSIADKQISTNDEPQKKMFNFNKIIEENKKNIDSGKQKENNMDEDSLVKLFAKKQEVKKELGSPDPLDKLFVNDHKKKEINPLNEFLATNTMDDNNFDLPKEVIKSKPVIKEQNVLDMLDELELE